MTTLREEVLYALTSSANEMTKEGADETLSYIADLLEATGAPAYIRVARDLRGEAIDTGPAA